MKFAGQTTIVLSGGFFLLMLAPLLFFLVLVPAAYSKADVEKRVDAHGVISTAPGTSKWPGWIEGTDNEGSAIRTKKESNGSRLVCPSYNQFPDGKKTFLVSRVLKDENENSTRKGFVDATGRVIVEPKYKWAEPFYNGLAPVREDKGKPWQLIDQQGAVKYTLPMDIAPKITVQSWGVSKDKFLVVEKGPLDTGKDYLTGVAGLFDLEKMQFYPFGKFASVYEPSEGLSQIGDPTANKDGYADTAGKMVITPQFESATSFSEDLAAVVKDHRRGYIDHAGKIVIQLPADCSDAEPFHEGLAAVAIGGTGDASIVWKRWKGAKWGFIDKTGKLVIKPSFYAETGYPAPAFSDGLANVAVGDELTRKYGFIDKSGKWVIQPQFKHASPFENGFAAVTIGEIAFNKEDWNRKTGMFTARADVFHNFLLQHGLIGMSRKAVQDLLGKADNTEHNDDTYTLISSDCANAYKGVQIHYHQGKVSEFRYTNYDHGSGPWITQAIQPDQEEPD